MNTDLSAFRAVDQHAHPLLRPELVTRERWRGAFTESPYPAVRDRYLATTLSFSRGLEDLAALLGCPPTEDGVWEARQALGPERLARRCFDAASLDCVLLDDGYLPADCEPWRAHGRLVPVRRVLRIEPLAEALLGAELSFERLVDAFRSALSPVPPGVVALKSIVAYRAGLDVTFPTAAEARESHARLVEEARRGTLRLTDRTFLFFLLGEALEVARETGLPLQLHTGFGDPDLDLRLSDPLHLRALLEAPRFRDVPLVLLHASYPFSRQAGFLAALYPNVFLDLGLAVPSLSVRGMTAAVRQLVELAPLGKVLFSSDARMIPELTYLGALWGRRIVSSVLAEAVADRELSTEAARDAAGAILAGNARRLYGLG